MSLKVAKAYFERADSPESTVDDLLELFARDAIVIEPHVGSYRGHDGIQDFFQALGEIFAEGDHDIERYHEVDNTIICEGSITGETVTGRRYEGVGVAEIMDFDDNDRISAFRVYVDYSAILDDIPSDVPDYRTVWDDH